jgi:hypothetical protein
MSASHVRPDSIAHAYGRGQRRVDDQALFEYIVGRIKDDSVLSDCVAVDEDYEKVFSYQQQLSLLCLLPQHREGCESEAFQRLFRRVCSAVRQARSKCRFYPSWFEAWSVAYVD